VKALLLTALSLSLLLAWGVRAHELPTPAAAGPCDAIFDMTEVVSSVDGDSAVISMMAQDDTDFDVYYGTTSGVYTDNIGTVNGAADTRTDLELTGLSTDTRYYYRVYCKGAADSDFVPRAEHSFRTRRAVGQGFKFAHIADSHYYQIAANAELVGPDGDAYRERLRFVRQTLLNIMSRDNDFVLFTGDDPMVHCGGCWAPMTRHRGTTTGGSASTQLDAELRYQIWLEGMSYNGFLADLPYFFVLGNHEAEMRLSQPQCNHRMDVTMYRDAREAMLVNPYDTFGGESHGRYYSFTWGDVLFVGLDVMMEHTALPGYGDAWNMARASEWTLGATQTAFLADALNGSSSAFNVVFAHHMVGGIPAGPQSCYYYGDNSLRATTDEMPTSDFLGEQKHIQMLMESTGAELMILGHMHVGMVGEKLKAGGVPSGIHHASGSQPATRAGGDLRTTCGSAECDDWRTRMDWDLDGTPDYEDEVTGSIKSGYQQFTVASDEITLEFIVTDPDDSEVNNQVLFSYTIPARAAGIVINNGLDCSNPANVIGDATYQGALLYVRNVGCPPGWPAVGNPWDGCPSPGAPTEVCLVDGGETGGLSAYDSSSIAVSGGTVGALEAWGSSIITVSGGTLGNYLNASDSSIITIVGSGFEVDGVPVPYGGLTVQTGTLAGTLASGDPINNVFHQGGGPYTGTITLTRRPSLRLPVLSLWGKLALAAILLGSVVRRRQAA
jgi:hypothetical protein